MRKHLALAALTLLTACGTPQEQCIHRASADYRKLQARISVVEGNIDRGYAIHKQEQPYKVARICYDKDKKPYACLETEFRTIETPVAINVAEERHKLSTLKRQLSDTRRKMAREIAACRERYPE